MTVREWMLHYVENVAKVYGLKEVNSKRVFKRHNKRHKINLQQVAEKIPIDDLTVIADQFHEITAEMIHEDHRKVYGKAHPKCPMPH